MCKHILMLERARVTTNNAREDSEVSSPTKTADNCTTQAPVKSERHAKLVFEHENMQTYTLTHEGQLHVNATRLEKELKVIPTEATRRYHVMNKSVGQNCTCQWAMKLYQLRSRHIRRELRSQYTITAPRPTSRLDERAAADIRVVQGG